MPGPEYEALLRRRRIWGVPPDVVEQMAAECDQERTELRARARELEARLANVTAERDETTRADAALQERIAQLEKEQAEVVGRPEMVREEALRFVVDAWAEAQMVREQTRQEIENAEAAAREEVAAIRQSLVEERRRHEAEMRETQARYEAEIAALRERRLRAIAELESLAENLLSQAARGSALKPPDAGLGVAPNIATPIAEAQRLDVPAAPPTQSPEWAAPKPQPAEASEPAPTPPPARAMMQKNGDTSEDDMLAKALDDLEAVLSASRKQNGSG